LKVVIPRLAAAGVSLDDVAAFLSST